MFVSERVCVSVCVYVCVSICGMIYPAEREGTDHADNCGICWKSGIYHLCAVCVCVCVCACECENVCVCVRECVCV